MAYIPQEIIAKKKQGIGLSADEIGYFINGLTSGAISDAQAAAFAMATYFQDMNNDERVALTLAMRDSGEVLDWSFLDGPVADKHSTGGVGDNVSLMLAPILAACGVYVPMISGRGLGHTGGTLDKLDAIQGFNTSPDAALFTKTVQETGCAIVGQTAKLAPADKALYLIRDLTATVDSIPLIVASILSKKLAAGLNALILDVKLGSGAIMPNKAQSLNLANALVDVANGAGMKTAALVTDMNEPLASAAGNALEVQNAAAFLTGRNQDPRLRELTLALCAEVLVVSGVEANAKTALDKTARALDNGAAAERFARMASRLGGPADFLERTESYLPRAAIIRDVYHEGSGVISQIDTKAVGMAVVALGGGRQHPNAPLDYAVGFDQLAGLGTVVDHHRPIARIHANDETTAQEGEKRLRAAYECANAAPAHPLIAARVGLEQKGR